MKVKFYVMQRLQLLIACFIFSVGSLTAQKKVGIVTGFNFSDSKFSIETKTEAQTNYFIGVLHSFYSKQKIRVSSKLLYSLKGFTSQPISSKFSYFDIGLIAEYKVLKPLWVGLGITYSHNLNELERIGNSPWESTKPFKRIKDSDLGVSLSTRVDYKDFYAFVSYEIGLLDISDISFTDVNGNPIEGPRQYNRVFQIGVGYYVF